MPREPQLHKVKRRQMNTLGEHGYKNTFIARLIIRFLEASLY